MPAKAHILAMIQDWKPIWHVLQKCGHGHFCLAHSLHLCQEVRVRATHVHLCSLNSWATPLRAALNSSHQRLILQLLSWEGT